MEQQTTRILFPSAVALSNLFLLFNKWETSCIDFFLERDGINVSIMNVSRSSEFRVVFPSGYFLEYTTARASETMNFDVNVLRKELLKDIRSGPILFILKPGDDKLFIKYQQPVATKAEIESTSPLNYDQMIESLDSCATVALNLMMVDCYTSLETSGSAKVVAGLGGYSEILCQVIQTLDSSNKEGADKDVYLFVSASDCFMGIRGATLSKMAFLPIEHSEFGGRRGKPCCLVTFSPNHLHLFYEILKAATRVSIKLFLEDDSPDGTIVCDFMTRNPMEGYEPLTMNFKFAITEKTDILYDHASQADSFVQNMLKIPKIASVVKIN